MLPTTIRVVRTSPPPRCVALAVVAFLMAGCLSPVPQDNGDRSQFVTTYLAIVPLNEAEANFSILIPVLHDLAARLYWTNATSTVFSVRSQPSGAYDFNQMASRFLRPVINESSVVSLSPTNSTVLSIQSDAALLIGIEWKQRWQGDLNPFRPDATDSLRFGAHDSGVPESVQIALLSWARAENLMTMSGSCDFLLTSSSVPPLGGGSVPLEDLSRTLIAATIALPADARGEVILARGQLRTTLE